MKFGTMIRDILSSFFTKPVTENYPFDKKKAPDRLRGKLIWDPQKCTGCQLCIRDCPTGAIELVVLDKVNKRFVLKYHVDQCIFCQQCVINCRMKCLDLSSEEYELASLDKEPFTVYYGKDEDVTFLLEKFAQPGTGECPPA
jgi:formate hydrogenlyase subunit 6/NADH:ubiquinone oxidoreductase subunit I